MDKLFQRLSERGSPQTDYDCLPSRRDVVEMQHINQQTSPADISRIVVDRVLENLDKQLKQKASSSK